MQHAMERAEEKQKKAIKQVYFHNSSSDCERPLLCLPYLNQGRSFGLKDFTGLLVRKTLL